MPGEIARSVGLQPGRESGEVVTFGPVRYGSVAEAGPDYATGQQVADGQGMQGGEQTAVICRELQSRFDVQAKPNPVERLSLKA